MATANPARIRHLEGRIAVSPTDLSIPFPFGGTAIGDYREARFDPGESFRRLVSEEYGTTIAVVAAGRRPVLRAILRDWDPDALGLLWPNTTLGAGSASRSIDLNAFETGKGRTGAEVSTAKIVLAPLDLEFSQTLILYKVVPLPAEAQEINFSLSEEAGLAVVFEAIPDSTGRLGRFGEREILAV